MQLSSTFFNQNKTADLVITQGQFNLKLKVKYAGAPKIAKAIEKVVSASMSEYAEIQRLVSKAETEQSEEMASCALLKSLEYNASLNEKLALLLVDGFFDDSNTIQLVDTDGCKELLQYFTSDSVKSIVEFASDGVNFGYEPLKVDVTEE